MTHPQPDTHFCIPGTSLTPRTAKHRGKCHHLYDGGQQLSDAARKLANSIDSSSPWQDAKNDTKKLEGEHTLMEFDTLDGGGLVAAMLQHHVIFSNGRYFGWCHCDALLM
jgi:hypothetical protein